jgi:hypothetical protein
MTLFFMRKTGIGGVIVKMGDPRFVLALYFVTFQHGICSEERQRLQDDTSRLPAAGECQDRSAHGLYTKAE